ncbi:hypothetical protein JKF63_07604 [Porcisia hertigi]|uniref:Uncharacterized protein n=1 Tax=Porcisia hertigi TaxID=2761500 RepID=A0A836LMC0_9TRYP|nr:hypothetical protein JKF63_07604 [Porcisia hertigi]
MTEKVTTSPPMETPHLPASHSDLESSGMPTGDSAASASTTTSAEDLKRLRALGTLLVNMGAASEEKVFGSKNSAQMLAYRERRMPELLVINRPQDDAAAHPFIWYKPWTWWNSGAQVSPIVLWRSSLQEGSAGLSLAASATRSVTSTQTEADVVAPPLPPDAGAPKMETSKRKKGLPVVDMRPLTDEEVDALTPAVREEREKLLGSEKRIHETLQGMEDTRYRYLLPSRDLKCEAEVMAVVQCYTERNEANSASRADDGGNRARGEVKASHEASGSGVERALVRSDLLACGPHVNRLQDCAESMVMRYSREECEAA